MEKGLLKNSVCVSDGSDKRRKCRVIVTAITMGMHSQRANIIKSIKMVHLRRVLAAKPYNLSPIPGTYIA